MTEIVASISRRLPEPCRDHDVKRECRECSKVIRTAALLAEGAGENGISEHDALQVCMDFIETEATCVHGVGTVNRVPPAGEAHHAVQPNGSVVTAAAA